MLLCEGGGCFLVVLFGRGPEKSSEFLLQ